MPSNLVNNSLCNDVVTFDCTTVARLELGQNDLTEIVESRLDSSKQNANLIEVTLLIINEVT